ncbi:MAG: YedE family putative selenium transporter [Oscillospiraceae bacterium]
MNKKKNIVIISVGLIIGVLSALLVKFGNPANMGFCIACFLRDIAGAMGLHRAEVVQYIRPEIIGIVLGSFVCALFAKEFKGKGGSSPATRFFLAAAVMIGALVFLGCPYRMVLRLAGGDYNAIIGLVGFVAGIGVGAFFLKKGFSLKRNYVQSRFEGYTMPMFVLILLILLVTAPSFIFFSEKGPGSMAAPVLIALAVGAIVGGLGQKTRLCMVGGIRDGILFKDFYLLFGFIAIFAAALVTNIALGLFNPGFAGQPVAHTESLWNFLGMVVVGFGSVLLGGCPFRQLVLAGEGNADSAITVLGFIVGAAFSHNFKLASSGEGATPNGKVAVLICLAFVFIVAVLNSDFVKSKAKKGEVANV